jgi:predicted nucleotidyltransferase
MRTDAAGQSPLLMIDVAEVLSARGIPYAVIGAMAAAVHGVVRASLDADAVISAHLTTGPELQREFAEKGYGAQLRIGDADDPIPALLQVTDPFANRVDLLIGLRGMDPAAMERASEVTLSGFTLKFIGREDFVAMKAHAGGPVDLADARAVIEANPAGLDTGLVRRIAAGFGTEAVRQVNSLLEEPR